MSRRDLWLAGLVVVLLVAGAALMVDQAHAGVIAFWNPPSEEATGDPDVPGGGSPYRAIFDLHAIRFLPGCHSVVIVVSPSRVASVTSTSARCLSAQRPRGVRPR
jgi:hypothetical protein